LFERDSRGQVLWFSGPPLAPGTIHIPEQPRHSLEYLDYLAKRRKGLDTTPIRLPRIEQELVVERLADEQIAESWWVKGMTSQDLEKALRATIQ
jgi:chromatin structure-remodeling complex subunit RSC1/2